jgi:predicted Zn-dependent peptidase
VTSDRQAVVSAVRRGGVCPRPHGRHSFPRRRLDSSVLGPPSLAWLFAVWLFLAAFLLTSIAFADDRTLSNGLRVVIEPRPALETVAIRLLIAGGDVADPPGKTGVARLHAALLLRGTRERTGFALARAAEELGGRLNSYSRAFAEAISLSLPAESAEDALRLVADVYLEPRLEAADLEKEKNLLSSSLATDRDEPSVFRQDEVYRTLFGSHPLRRLALPRNEDVQAVQIGDIREFDRSHRDARRLALLIVGNCDEKRLTSLAERLLGKIPASAGQTAGLSANLAPPAALAADASRHVSKRSTQPEISVALPTAGISDAETPAYDLLRHILGGFQERLYDEIREKRGWAYWVRAEGLSIPGAGYFSVTTGAHKEHLSEIDQIIRGELKRVASAPVSAAEQTRAARYLRTEEARRDATNAGRISVIAEQLVAGSPPRTYAERVARLEAVTPAQIQALAHRLFAGKHLAVVTMY